MKENKKRSVHYMTALIGTVILIALDQWTKYLAVTRLKGNEPFVIWKNVFQLEYLENRGAAFGLFQNQRGYFYASVAVISVVIIIFYLCSPMQRRFLPLRLCMIGIMAGAWGNCIDRVRLNYVVDFLYFKLIDFPIFNVADIYVTVSTIMLVILVCFYYKEEELEGLLHHRKSRGGTD